MKETLRSQEKLQLTADRKLAGIVNLLAAPFTIWLGQKIVEEGGTVWFGWCFSGLGVVMIIGGILVFFLRISLTLDAPLDLIRFTHHAFGRRRNRSMALSDLEKVVMREVAVHRSTSFVLDFVPKETASSPTLTIKEFWTKASAEAARGSVVSWLAERRRD